MSFAYKAKLEVLKQKIENDCCSIAFLSAIIKCSGQLGITENGKYAVEIFTEIEELYERVNDVIRQYYGRECTLEVAEETNIAKSVRYRITLPEDITDQVLIDLGIMGSTYDGYKTINNGISNFLVADECCKRAYIMGAFVSCATSNIVIKSYNNESKNNSGYHLEFVFNFENLATDFVRLLADFDIHAKITIRKNCPIVYIKEYQLICDTLALVGAGKSVLQLQNEAAIREVRNNVNRQTNCFNANLNKTVKSSVKQLNAIKTIQEYIGLENIDESLADLCFIRLANPDESLENLSKLFPYPITKSGINHRFNKLYKLESEIKSKNMRIKTL